MASSSWRYFAQRLRGDGTNVLLHPELPLEGVQLTDTLSGPGRLTGELPLDLQFLKAADGKSILEPWSTAIYAEADGQVVGGGILMVPDVDGPSLSLDCMGFSGYPNGQPFLDSYYGVQVDPMDEARHIWSYLQAQPMGNLGVVLDSTTSPKRIGTELEQVQFDSQAGPVAFEAGPYKLAWWVTDDLGKAFSDLASETPFDYHEELGWNADRTAVTHRLALGYPRLGVRRENLRFVLNENVTVAPKLSFDGDAYANAVQVLGAGEGRDMVRSPLIDVNDGRLRRVVSVPDKSIKSVAAATAKARTQLVARSLLSGSINEVVVRDHSHAPLGSWSVGDDIRVQFESGWADVDLWCRVLTTTISPDGGDIATITIQRSEISA